MVLTKVCAMSLQRCDDVDDDPFGDPLSGDLFAEDEPVPQITTQEAMEPNPVVDAVVAPPMPSVVETSTPVAPVIPLNGGTRG